MLTCLSFKPGHSVNLRTETRVLLFEEICFFFNNSLYDTFKDYFQFFIMLSELSKNILFPFVAFKVLDPTRLRGTVQKLAFIAEMTAKAFSPIPPPPTDTWGKVFVHP